MHAPPLHQESARTTSHDVLTSRQSLSGSQAEYYRSVSNLHTLDQIAINCPAHVCTSVLSLARHLVQACDEAVGEYVDSAHRDFSLLRVLYRWVSNNIDYDVQGLSTGISTRNCQAEVVLQERKAVCSGYANLPKALCQVAGLEVYIVNGWAKGVGYTVGDTIGTGTATNHAWNTVVLGGQSYHLDPTWSAGHTNGPVYTRQWQEHYFLTPSHLFVLDHLPENSTKQFLEPPVTHHEFSCFPAIKPTFFLAGMRLLSHHKCLIQMEKMADEFTLEFETHHGEDWHVLPPTLRARQPSHDNSSEIRGLCLLSRPHSKSVRIIVRAPAGPGDFVLTCFAKPKDATLGVWTVEYLVRVLSSDQASLLRFPESVHPEAQLLEPLNLHLSIGAEVLFRHKVVDSFANQAGKVSLVLPGNEWVFLDDLGNGVFEKLVRIAKPGEVAMCVVCENKQDMGGGRWSTTVTSLYTVAVYQAVQSQ